MKIRQSMLGSADKCLRALQYDIQGPPDGRRATGIARELGTAYHGGLEVLYSLAPVMPELAEIVEPALDSLDKAVETYGDLFSWTDAVPDVSTAKDLVVMMLADYLRNERYWPVFGGGAEWSVLGTEVNFNFPAPDLTGPFTGEINTQSGTIDLVLLDPHDWIVAVDHKTAGRAWDEFKHKPRKNNQAPWYTPATALLYPGHPGYRFVFDIMTYLKPTQRRPTWEAKFERRISDPGLDHVEATREKARSIIYLLDATLPRGVDLPTNSSSTLCSPLYCDHWRYCIHGAALDR